MIVPSMNTKEVVIQIVSDYAIVKSKAEHFTESLRRKAIKSPSKHAHGVLEYVSKNKNNWIIIADHYKKDQIFTTICWYVDKFGLHGYMVNLENQILVHARPHFLRRYNERFINQPRFGKKDLLERFFTENSAGVFRTNENKLFVRNREGISLGENEKIGPLTINHYNTYITAQMIRDNQLDEFDESTKELIRYYESEYKFTKKGAII